MKAVVVGGGLAGLAAALELADAAHEVLVLEARPTLGGAVQTLPERDGDPDPPPDNGQHIALGCFSRYQAFLERVGKLGALRREPLALPVFDERGRESFVRAGALGLLRYGHVSAAGRFRIARAAKRIAGLRPADHADRTFADLLRSLGQRAAEIDRFWDVFIRPALNLPAAEAGADYGVFTVQTALLAGPSASDLLLPTEPLGEMHGAAAGRALEAAGARVRTGERVDALDDLDADAIVLAAGPTETARLLGEPDPGLEDSPIVSAHLLFDRRLIRHPLAALLASPAHWVFDRGALTGRRPEEGQYLTVVSSGAPELLELRGRELVDAIDDALQERFGPAGLLWSRLSREPRATFAPRPDTRRLRLPAATARAGVVRAGAWTASEWPATMEAAVASGERAARLLIANRPAGAERRGRASPLSGGRVQGTVPRT
jgi:squalene-associated FAD-dependent desaturase